jgi:hypothetical protein
MLEAAKEQARNATSVLNISWISNIFSPKNIGKKTNRFLIHWLGRVSLRRL